MNDKQWKYIKERFPRVKTKCLMIYCGQHKVDAAKSDIDIGRAWRLAHTQYEYFSNPANGYINGDVIIITDNG